MSRSCQRATSSRPAKDSPQYAGQPQQNARRDRVALVRMAELPFCPGLNGSSASPSSLLAMWRTSVAINSIVARRPRRPTGTRRAVPGHHLGGRRRHQPEGRAHIVLDPGSMLEYVPTAPDSLPTATRSRALRSLCRSRSAWRAHSENLARKSSARRACRGCGRSRDVDALEGAGLQHPDQL